MTTDQKTEAIRAILEDKKGQDIQVIPLEGKTLLADRFILVTGNSMPHIRTLTDELTRLMKEQHGLSPHHVEGMEGGRWVLLDYRDVVVHVFHPEERQYYSLEKLWERRGGHGRGDADA